MNNDVLTEIAENIEIVDRFVVVRSKSAIKNADV